MELQQKVNDASGSSLKVVMYSNLAMQIAL